jgi:pimeloyl-ACP methyl ester carboxylesterase
MYQAFLADVVARLDRGPMAVVASALSAAYMVALAARDPRHVAALALIEPEGMGSLRGTSSTTTQSVAQLLLEAPIVGTSIYNGLTSPASIRRFLEESYANDRLVTEDLVEQYVQNARQPGGKHVVGALLGGRLNVDIRNALRRVRHPMLLVWGDQARQNPVQHAHAFRVLKPETEWALIPNAGDLPHDEQPERTNAVLLGFLDRVKSGTRGRGPSLVSA